MKVKSSLRSKLPYKFCKPITEQNFFIEIRDVIKLLLGMVEMAYCLPYKYEDHTTEINLIDVLLEKINSQVILPGRETDLK